jgi:glycosyltransferase involved in cell wall biosynthesis
MTMAEAMLLGKPTIATAYSSNTDFMNVTNSYPVGYKLVELAKDYGPYKKGQVWADPDVDHAAAQMRRIVEDPAEALQIGARARSDIERLYSSEAIAQKIIRRLEAIASRL